jgi:steroid delta-isomerase-like uncharacterized protein
MRPIGGERPRRKWRALAPLAGIALVAVVVGERLRRLRRSNASEGSAMLDANKTVSRRIIEEVFNQGRYEVLDELVAPTFVQHDPSSPMPVEGIDGLRQFIDLYRTSFPDLKITIEDQIAEGDRVATRWTAVGTHQADLLGISATGKQATVTGITIDTIADGKLAASHNNWDTLGMLQQLGVVPSLAPA